MALYHFSVNSNRRGTTTGKNKSDYLNREGKYKNLDLKEEIKRQTFSGNTITGKSDAETHARFQSLPKNLYQNICGSIKKNDKGQIEVSDNASDDTLALAIVLTKKIYGDTFQVTGSTSFKAKIITECVKLDYNINFTDPAMNQNFSELKKEEYDRLQRIESRNTKANWNERFREISIFDDLKSIDEKQGFISTQGENSLQILSVGNMDGNNESSGMLLYGNETERMEHQEKESNISLRRNVYKSQTKLIEQMADKILQKNKGISGASHSDYINRADVFAAKGGCVYKENFLPKWTKGSSRRFFDAADKFEPKRGVPYLEIQPALQQELTLEQNLEIVHLFLKRCDIFKDKYYAFAIHDKEAALDSSQQQIHCHLMFSTRCIDDIERKQERSPKVFFSRCRPHNPQLGGCRKDRRFSNDNKKEKAETLANMRKLWADITNEVFSKYGIDAQISHKSLAAQREDALKDKNFIKAEELYRTPEQHLGPQACAQKDNPSVIALQKARQENKKRIYSLYMAAKAEKVLQEMKFEAKVDISCNNAQKVTLDDKTNNLFSNDHEYIDLKNNVIKLTDLISDTRKNILSYNSVSEKARCFFMTNDEYTAYSQAKIITNKETNLKKELDALLVSNTNQERQTQIKLLLKKYTSILDKNNELVSKINKRLSTPELESQITKKKNQILKGNEPSKQKLYDLTNQLDETTNRLRAYIIDNIDKANSNKQKSFTKYTAIKVKYLLENMQFELDKTIKIKEKNLESLLPKVLSDERAKIIALDIVTKQNYKKLREITASLNKDIQLLNKVKENISSIKFNMAGLNKSDPIQYSKLKAAYDKNIQKQLLLEKNISNSKEKINKLGNTISELIKKPEIKIKIDQIIHGVLTKNASIREQYNKLSKNVSDMKKQYHSLEQLSKVVSKQIKLDKGKNICYAVKSSPNSAGFANDNSNKAKWDNRNAAIIAAAFSNNINMAANVIRIQDDKYDEFADYISMNAADRQAREANSGRYY